MRILGINNGIDLISQLANNNDSLAPMLVKDTLSNVASASTYRKHGTKEDAAEKLIEGFLTGAFWIFGIPTVKKVIDSTVYPFFKLNPKLDTNVIIKQEDILKESKNAAQNGGVKKFFYDIFNGGLNKQATKNIQDTLLKSSSNAALSEEKQLFATLGDENEVAKKLLSNFNPLKIKTPSQ